MKQNNSTNDEGKQLSPAFAKLPVSRKAKELLCLPQYPSAEEKFVIGDVVRSYRSGFDQDLPYKNYYSQGVVIATEDKVLGDKYIVVKWQITNFFGQFFPCRLPHNNSDTFPISVRSPHLVRLGVLELPFC